MRRLPKMSIIAGYADCQILSTENYTSRKPKHASESQTKTSAKLDHNTANNKPANPSTNCKYSTLLYHTKLITATTIVLVMI